MIKMKKHMSMNGDSRGVSGKSKPATSLDQAAVAAVYRNLRIGRPVGKPSIPKAKIVAAVRAVMKEDGMI